MSCRGWSDCPFPVWEDELCPGHYKQRRMGYDLSPLRPRRKPGAAIPPCRVPDCVNGAEGNDPLCRMHRARLTRLGPHATHRAILNALTRPPRRMPWLHRKRASAA